MSTQEYINIPYVMRLMNKLTLPKAESEFVRGLKEGKLLGTKCPVCHRVMIPPRIFCGLCDAKVEEKLIEQGNRGRLINIIKVEMEQLDSETGEMKMFPYPIGSVELDGGAKIDCWVDVDDISSVKLGIRVEALWKSREERQGTLKDIICFKPIKE